MDIIFNIKANILVVELYGELDHHAAVNIRKDIDETIAAYGTRDLLLDFSKVTFMDSSGIGVILGRYRKLSVEGGHIAACCCSLTVRNILNMAGVFSVIDYFDTQKEAMDYLCRKEVQ